MTCQQQQAIIDEKVVEAIIQKAMQGKDHFDDNDFIYATMMTPNLRCPGRSGGADFVCTFGRGGQADRGVRTGEVSLKAGSGGRRLGKMTKGMMPPPPPPPPPPPAPQQ